jgi:ABC-type branched-subunit amino acid transport system ATPase component
MSFLEFERLSAGYGNAVVLREVTLHAGESEVLAVVGRNGAGKSTLLNSPFGIPAIFGGRILIGGERVNAAKAFRAAQMGVAIAPQGKRILTNLTVQENLVLGAATRRAGEWDLDGVYALFPILKERSHRPGTALSGGQQQMLAIGRALMANPRVLLLDEPSEGLAPVLIDQIVDALLAIRRNGTGLVIVEQHLNLVRRVADRFVILVKGELAGEGRIDEIDAPDLRATIAL